MQTHNSQTVLMADHYLFTVSNGSLLLMPVCFDT